MSEISKPLGPTYPGGKGCAGVYQSIINCMPPHEVYIEAFLGGGSVFLHKRPSFRSIGIDADSRVIAAWKNSRYSRLEVVHGNAIELLKTWPWGPGDRTRTLLYCDPPYLQAVRRSQRQIYRCDLPRQDCHKELLTALKSLPCMVMLSGYSSPLYESLLGDWLQVHFQTKDRAGHPRLETIWMNYPEPSTLHDYRYLGHGFRERERIKRQQNRWKTKLLRMSTLEQQALVRALNELVMPGNCSPNETLLG